MGHMTRIQVVQKHVEMWISTSILDSETLSGLTEMTVLRHIAPSQSRRTFLSLLAMIELSLLVGGGGPPW